MSGKLAVILFVAFLIFMVTEGREMIESFFYGVELGYVEKCEESLHGKAEIDKYGIVRCFLPNGEILSEWGMLFK